MLCSQKRGGQPLLEMCFSEIFYRHEEVLTDTTSKVDVAGSFLLTERCYHQSTKGREIVYVLTTGI